MKGLLVFTVLATFCYALQMSQEFSNKVRAAWKKCKGNLDNEAYMRLTERLGEAKNYEERCFKRCFSENIGYMNGSAVVKERLLEDNKQRWSDPEELSDADEMIEYCYREHANNHTDLCDIAGNFSMCMREEIMCRNLSFPTLHPK